jgi:hypothetical protein
LQHAKPRSDVGRFDVDQAVSGEGVEQVERPIFGEIGNVNGRLVLTFCRESLAEARRLEQGRLVDYDPERRSFVPQKTFPELMGRMRWFLRDGGRRDAPYGEGPVVAQAPTAALVLPCLRPEDLNATLALRAPRDMPRVALNRRVVVELQARAQLDRLRVLFPGGLLFRGGNEVRLLADRPGLRLVGLRVRAAPEEPSWG